MANNSTNQAKVEVNGDAPGLNPTLQNQITMGLAQNGGLKRIEAKLKEGLDEAGWSQTVREYATLLLRNGEVTTYPELEEKVKRHIFADSNGNTTNDNSGGAPAPNLAVPREALERGAAQVRKELAGVLEMKK